MDDLQRMKENILKSIQLEELYKNTSEWPNASRRIHILKARLKKIEECIRDRNKDKVVDVVKFLVRAYVALR